MPYISEKSALILNNSSSCDTLKVMFKEKKPQNNLANSSNHPFLK